MCPGHEANGEFAGESGNLYREWWRTENLRFSLILQIVENQRSKLENKKAERCVRSAKRQKNGGAYLCESKLILCFCKSLITKHSHRDTGIWLPNSVLKQAKMVSIYQKKSRDTKKSRNNQSRFPAKIPAIYKKNSPAVHK